MSYDCLIIGGGIAGLTCGIKCAKSGLRTVIISSGASALHAASGSIDILGYCKGKSINGDINHELKRLIKSNPSHPYAKTGAEKIWESACFIVDELGKAGINLFHMKEKNHFHMTSLGVLKPTFLSQRSVFNDRLLDAYKKKAPVALLNFKGYRDYYPELAVNQLKKNRLMRGVPITSGLIELPWYTKSAKNMLEFRSVDLARVFDTEKYLPRMSREIIKAAGNALVVSLPDFIGMENFEKIHTRLEEMTGKLIVEIPNLPPSILGMRIENGLRSRFAFYGGEFSSGDTVTSGSIADGKVEYISTENYGSMKFRAKYYLLASGSFFSGGLRSEYNYLEEPVFKLKIHGSRKRKEWYSQKFLDRRSHPFLEYGVETGNNLNPLDSSSRIIKNLFCAGSVLAGYNPVREGSGGGVAIATGYTAAGKIIKNVISHKIAGRGSIRSKEK